LAKRVDLGGYGARKALRELGRLVGGVGMLAHDDVDDPGREQIG
jgi:hypothetical protein